MTENDQAIRGDALGQYRIVAGPKAGRFCVARTPQQSRSEMSLDAGELELPSDRPRTVSVNSTIIRAAITFIRSNNFNDNFRTQRDPTPVERTAPGPSSQTGTRGITSGLAGVTTSLYRAFRLPRRRALADAFRLASGLPARSTITRSHSEETVLYCQAPKEIWHRHTRASRLRDLMMPLAAQIGNSVEACDVAFEFGIWIGKSRPPAPMPCHRIILPSLFGIRQIDPPHLRRSRVCS